MRPRPSRSSAVRARRLGGLACLLILAGCAAAARPPAPVAPEAAAALALVAEHAGAFRDLRTRAQVDIERAARRDRLSGVLLLRAPAALRFEALAPLGTPLLVVAADGDTLTLWEIPDNRAWLLAPTPEATARWLGVALGVEDLVPVLAGRVRLLDRPDEVRLVPADQVGPSLVLSSGERRQQVWFDPASGRPRAVDWTGGKHPARVVFDPAPGEAPAGLTLTTGDGGLRVRVSYQDPAADAGLDPDRLRLRLPDSVRVQDMR